MPSKILLAVDLDYTHFDTHKKDKETGNYSLASSAWFHSPAFWVQMYQQFVAAAAKENIEVIFAVVTSKGDFDDLCQEAAKHFKPFLSKCKENMFMSFDSHDYFLIEYPEQNAFAYAPLEGSTKHAAPKTETFSHFIILNEYSVNKSTPILKLANRYGISPHHCTLIDDCNVILKDAASKNINCISMECFYAHERLVELESPEYINAHLDRIKAELFHKLEEIIETIKSTEKLQSIKASLENSLEELISTVSLSQPMGIYFDYERAYVNNGKAENSATSLQLESQKENQILFKG